MAADTLARSWKCACGEPPRLRADLAFGSPRLRLDRALPSISAAVAALRSAFLAIDGEAVCCDDDGVAVFEKLHSRAHDAEFGTKSGRIHLVHFFCSPFWFTHTPVRLAVIIRCSQLMVENVHALTARSYGPSVTVRILTQSLKYSAHVRVASAALADNAVTTAIAMR